jgi:hypothetical protein
MKHSATSLTVPDSFLDGFVEIFHLLNISGPGVETGTSTRDILGPGVAWWLRHYATSLKVSGSIPSGVTGDFLRIY